LVRNVGTLRARWREWNNCGNVESGMCGEPNTGDYERFHTVLIKNFLSGPRANV
jgi:hypothetical protein